METSEIINNIDILECKSQHIELRSNQTEYLLWLQENFDKYRIFVSVLDTGSGKSICATTAANWAATNNRGKVALVTGNRILQDQYKDDFPWLTLLKGATNYNCNLIDNDCRSHKAGLGSYCQGCVYVSAVSAAAASDVAIYNFQSLIFSKQIEDKKILIIDEAQNTEKALYQLYEKIINPCDFDYKQTVTPTPDSITSFLNYVITCLEMDLTIARSNNKPPKQIAELEDEISRYKMLAGLVVNNWDDYAISVKSEKLFNRRSPHHDTMQQVVHLKPVSLKKIASVTLFRHVDKIIFLSATFNTLDLEVLGLDEKDCAIYDGDPIIPASQRPFKIWPVANMAYKNRKGAIPIVVTAIEKLATLHKDEKGLIHCTYETNKVLSQKLGGDRRFLFHDQKNKNDIYKYFKESKEPLILVASGMSEGIDLPYDACRWQVITQVMYPNLKDPVNEFRLHRQPRLYNWDTIRTVLQQFGRVCRGPADFGATYILDSQFVTLYNRTKHMRECWPRWFAACMVWPKGKT